MEETTKEQLGKLKILAKTVVDYMEKLECDEYSLDIAMAISSWEQCENWLVNYHQVNYKKKKMEESAKDLLTSILKDCDDMPSC